MIKVTSMLYVYFLIQTKKKIMHNLSPQRILMKNTLHLIAETDNIKDLQHGWDYTLRELIENYKNNCYQKISGDNVQSIKLIPFHKCTYCDKELSSQEEKKKHEFVWHI